MQIKRYDNLDQTLYDELIKLWRSRDITNPERADSFEAISHSLAHTGHIITAEDDGKILGALWVNHDYRRLYIHHMAVSLDHENQGIGRSLLQEALKIAKETGYQAKLEVHRDNSAARHLYASLGFKDLDGYITMIKREL
nr:[ribosomal protein S18]-alanine N-acetyltransferase [Candidatus Cloacimonadota bacterium]